MTAAPCMRYPLRAFFTVNFFLLTGLHGYIARDMLVSLPLPGVMFLLAAMVGYVGLLLLLVAGAAALLGLVLGSRWQAAVAVVLAGLLTILLLTDSQIYGMYGFHLNGFVWNLLVTPGGVESMGGSDATVLTVVVIAGAILLLQAGLWLTLRGRRVPGLRYGVVVLLLCMLGERAAYGLSHLKGYQPVLLAAQSIPFYQPTTFRRYAEKFGVEMVRNTRYQADVEGRLDYPKRPLVVATPAPTPNIVMLVCESLRWDMLTPEIMPNLWRFAQAHGSRFTDHYSGGNGTRMGIFSLFYGLPGNYWFSVLDERKPPVFMQRLQQAGYRMGLYTSAEFSFPEFDKTVFVSVPEEQLHSDDAGLGWQRDRRNVARLLDFLGAQGEAPLFGFMFFESSHARYYFPPESVIREDYLAELNYATMDLQADMPGIFNRYINASHHLDQQLGRVFDAMEQQGLLDNTIVLVTGDHGEEFMENGRWGHNSEFHNQQIHVPMVLAVPGREPGVIDRATSHLDVMPTLLPLLGVNNPAADYSRGVSMFAAEGEPYRLVSSWDALAYVGPDYKVAMPLKAGGLGEMAVTDHEDQPVASARVLPTLNERLAQVLLDLSSFFRK